MRTITTGTASQAGTRCSCLEPDTHFKFGYIEAISEVFKEVFK